MERLTFVDEDGQVLFDNPAGFPEDVGFTIRELAENEEWETLDNIAQRLANCEQRLKHYEDLAEKGKLLKLPCAVGDAVYVNHVMQGWHFKMKDRPYEGKVAFIGINGADNCMHVAFGNGCMLQFWFSEIGKTIFLTRETAETALKELEGCKGK